MRAIDLGVELGAKVYVFWGGREGVETDAAKDPVTAIQRTREAMNFLCEYAIDQGYDLQFALEAKPNEPRGDMYNATTGHMLAFIATLDHPEMVGVNPEVAHEHMAGLNFLHDVAQAWEAGKLFHIDLNDQAFGRYDQDFRFGAVNLKTAFFLVKFLEDVGYNGSRHFDAHAYRTEDYEGVKDFARGCMRTYLILKEKAAQWNADAGDPGPAGRDQRRRRQHRCVEGRLQPDQGRGAQGRQLRPSGAGRARPGLRAAGPVDGRVAAGCAVGSVIGRLVDWCWSIGHVHARAGLRPCLPHTHVELRPVSDRACSDDVESQALAGFDPQTAAEAWTSPPGHGTLLPVGAGSPRPYALYHTRMTAWLHANTCSASTSPPPAPRRC